MLFVALVLLFVNWGLESMKWRYLMRNSIRITPWTSFKATYTGNAFGALTPNRIGGFIGRIMYLPKEHRLEGTLNSFLSGFTQMLSTLIFGAVGAWLVFLLDYPLQPSQDTAWALKFALYPKYVAIGSSVIAAVALLIFLRPSVWLPFLMRIKWLRKFEERLQFMNKQSRLRMLQVLVMSMIRYVVFVFQFYLLLQFFEVAISWWDALILISYLYVLITFIPSIFGKLGLREAMALVLLYHFSPDHSELPIVLASLCLWFVNVAIAGVLGGFFFLLHRNKT